MHAPAATDRSPSYEEAEARAAALLAETDKLGAMVPAAAKARAVLAYSGDRCKRALACAITDAKHSQPPGEKPASHASLETIALASTAYRDAIAELQKTDEDAELAVAEWQAQMAKVDALKMVVALERQKAGML